MRTAMPGPRRPRIRRSRKLLVHQATPQSLAVDRLIILVVFVCILIVAVRA